MSTFREALPAAVAPEPLSEHVTSLLGKVAPFTSINPIQLPKAPPFFAASSAPAGFAFAKTFAVSCVPIGNSQACALGSNATIEPSVDFSKLTTVMVIRDFDGKGEGETDETN